MSATNAPPDERTLRDFLLGTLAPAQAEKVAAWLSVNPAAADHLRRLQVDDPLTRALAGKAAVQPVPVAAVESVIRTVLHELAQGTTAVPPAAATPSHGAAAGRAGPLTLQPGQRPIPDYDYVLVRQLGAGGFGEVWQARGPGGIDVALKFIRLDARGSELELRSLEVMKAIRHPNLAGLSSVWRTDQLLILAMELCDRSLQDRLNEALDQNLPGIPVRELLGYIRGAAEGLDALHDNGVQHRDVKPGNLLLLQKGVKVADFGLAKVLDHTAASHTGAMTVSYAAPEFFMKTTSQHSDQYSLAATYVHLRTGHLLFEGSYYQVAHGHMDEQPDLSRLPTAEQAVLARALAKEPEKRWRTCKTFVNELIKAHQAPPSKPPQPQHAGKQAIPKAGQLAQPTICPPSPESRRESGPTELGKPQTKDKSSPQPSPSRGTGWLWTVSALLLLMLLPLVPVGYFYGGQIIRVVTDQGQIVVEVDDPKIEVTVKEKGVVLQDGPGRREITVASGAHELEVTIKDAAGETRLLTKKFTLSRGGQEVVNVRQELAALTKKPEPMPELKKMPEGKKPDSEPKKEEPIPPPIPEPKKPDPEPQKPESKKLPPTLTVDLGGGVKMEFVLIDPKSKPDGGAFQMGDANGGSDEKPHPVRMVKPYYLSKYVVTQEQYQQVTGDNPSYFCSGGKGADKVGQNTNKFPVEEVSWDKADSYCANLTNKYGNQLPAELRQKGYRFALPTEAQWEYACRAGTKTRYFFGDDAKQLGDHAWFDDNSGGHTHAVTEKDTSNPWGLYDMHGNVWQWCQDYYDAGYYANSPIEDPFNRNKPDPERRVLRGGSWLGYAKICRAASRYFFAPDVRNYYVGFRVCVRLD